MAYLKIFVITILLAGAAFVGYQHFYVEPQRDLALALQAFQSGDYDDAETLIHKIGTRIPASQSLLYSAYIYRAQDHLEKSDDALATAELIASEQPNRHKNLLLEIALNQAYNNYLSQNTNAFKETLHKAEQLDPQNSWVQFFGLIQDFCQADYLRVQHHWRDVLPPETLSGWMQTSFKQTFTPLWFSIHFSHCKIGNGHFAEGRKTLKTILLENSSAFTSDQFNLLMGQSFMKEAQEVPADISILHHQLAFSYFNQMPLRDEKFAADREKISADLVKTVLTLLDEQSYDNLSFYLDNLQELHSERPIAQLSNYLVNTMNQDLDEDRWEQLHTILVALAPILPKGSVRQEIALRLQDLSQHALYAEDLVRFPPYVDTALLFTDDKTAYLERLEAIIDSKISELVDLDDQQLTKIQPYIALWKRIEKDSDKRVELAEMFLTFSNQFWFTPNQEQKALNLMKLAATLPYVNDKAKLDQSIGYLVQSVSLHVTKGNQVEKLPYLLDAVHSLNLSAEHLVDKKSIANYLADATFLYTQNRFQDASKVVDWLLLINAGDQQARSLAAMIDYNEANYARALDNFALLTQLDAAHQEPLAVCHTLVGDRIQGLRLLSKLQLSQDAYYRIGIGLLAAGQHQDGVEWLKQIKEPNSEVTAALVFGSYKVNDWQAAVANYDQLTTPYCHLNGLLEAVVLSNISLNNATAVEEKLYGFHRHPSELAELPLSPPFRVFKQKQLDPFDVKQEISTNYQSLNSR